MYFGKEVSQFHIPHPFPPAFHRGRALPGARPFFRWPEGGGREFVRSDVPAAGHRLVILNPKGVKNLFAASCRQNEILRRFAPQNETE